jgi:protein tyrosine phosphatase
MDKITEHCLLIVSLNPFNNETLNSMSIFTSYIKLEKIITLIADLCYLQHLSGELHLKHYQYNGWNQSEKVPHKVEPFLKLAKDVENEVKGQREDRPIVVHCL